jgi:hypothetical protein
MSLTNDKPIKRITKTKYAEIHKLIDEGIKIIKQNFEYEYDTMDHTDMCLLCFKMLDTMKYLAHTEEFVDNHIGTKNRNIFVRHIISLLDSDKINILRKRKRDCEDKCTFANKRKKTTLGYMDIRNIEYIVHDNEHKPDEHVDIFRDFYHNDTDAPQFNDKIIELCQSYSMIMYNVVLENNVNLNTNKHQYTIHNHLKNNMINNYVDFSGNEYIPVEKLFKKIIMINGLAKRRTRHLETTMIEPFIFALVASGGRLRYINAILMCDCSINEKGNNLINGSSSHNILYRE